MLLGLFPYLIQAVAKMGNMTRIHFDSSFFSAADDMVKDVLEALKGRVQITKTDEEIRVTLDLELLMEIVEEYLRKEYAGEGGASSMLKKVDEKLGTLSVTAAMKIPHRYVYVSLTDVEVNASVLEQLVEEIAPSHLYILSTGNELRDVFSKPRFVAENKVLWGRVKYLPISKLLQTTMGLEGATDFHLSPNRVTFSLKTLF